MPVDEKGQSLREPSTPFRVVVKGDTLYSIAWETGRDYRELASWNGIEPPYLILPGQRLRLHPPGVSSAYNKASEYVVSRGDTLYSIARRVGVNHQQLADWNGLRSPFLIVPGQKLKTAPPNDKRVTNQRQYSDNSGKGSNRTRRVTVTAGRGSVRWNWPAKGSILARFDMRNSNKGIDIGGQRGQPVNTAAKGRVVYQGSGLRGYGKLVIIKHNEDFLSAYAHCNRIYVKEGDVIKTGQKIAEMGNSGAERVKLHFEIRYRGNPVDPLKYLPRR